MRVLRSLNSLAAQLSLLSFVLIALIVIQFILTPLPNYGPGGSQAGLERLLVQNAVFAAISETPSDLEKIETLEIVTKIRSKNPRFRLYVEGPDEKFSIGGPPYGITRQGWMTLLEETAFRLGDEKDSEQVIPCDVYSIAALAFEEDDLIGYAFLNNCPRLNYYFEVYGIENSVLSKLDIAVWRFERLTLQSLRAYLIVVGGVLLIGLFIIYRVARAVNRVAKTASAINYESNTPSNPEVSVPLEFQPLIKSLDDMQARIAASREREGFFLATAAHELRTPLAVLRTRLEGIPDSNVKIEIKADLKRVSRLIEQLLRLTKLKMLQNVTLDVVDLAHCVRDVCAAIAPIAIDRDIQLNLVTDNDQDTVLGDARLIAVCVSNLLDNAISVSPPNGEVTITLPGDGIVKVRDQGLGVSEEMKATIFEPFAKSPPNRNGHGLGLAIVATIMELHQGEAGVTDSTVDSSGAEFWLRFRKFSRAQ